MRAYAAIHGYDFFDLNPAVVAPQCVGKFSFRKHCAVAHWLKNTKPTGYTALVLERNSVLVSNRSLTRWLEDDADLIFYLHSWKFEVVADNYIVRNTELGRSFLHLWSSYHNHQRPEFSHGGTGAIHLAILAAIDGHRSESCRRKYDNLGQQFKGNVWPARFTQL